MAWTEVAALVLGGGSVLGWVGAAMSRNSDLRDYAESCLRWAYGVLAQMESARDAKFSSAPTLPEGPPQRPKVWFPPLGWFETIEDRANDVRAAVADWRIVIGKDTSEWEASWSPTYQHVTAKVAALRDAVIDVGRASVVWCGPRFARMVRLDRLGRENPASPAYAPALTDSRGLW